MKLELFYDIHTHKELSDRLCVLQSLAEEHCIPYDSALKVENTEYGELTYVMSSMRGGYIQSNYFSYKENSGLVGVVELKAGCKQLSKIADAKYNQVVNIHPFLWVCLRSDLNFDVIYNGEVIIDCVQSYDVLALGSELQFLQLNYQGVTSLICLDLNDLVTGVHLVKSKDDFEQWFYTQVSRRGYEGKLDNVLVSELFQVYFEVVNEIFQVCSFKALV